MTYSITVVVKDGKATVETSGEVHDGRYEIAGTPDDRGPNPGVRFTRHENYHGPADGPAGRKAG